MAVTSGALLAVVDGAAVCLGKTPPEAAAAPHRARLVYSLAYMIALVLDYTKEWNVPRLPGE